MRADYRAVLDACVLLPMPLADTLLRLAEHPRLYLPKWTDEIIDEVTRNLILRWNVPENRAIHRREQLQKHFPEAWVYGYEKLIPAMSNSEKDRHVLAAAVRCGAEVVVTFNAKDFPNRPWSIGMSSGKVPLHSYGTCTTWIRVSSFTNFTSRRAPSAEKKGTYGDYLRLLEFYRETHDEQAREIVIRWVDTDSEETAPLP